MLTGKQMREALLCLLDDTKKKSITWIPTNRGFKISLKDYHFFLFTKGKKSRTEIFAAQIKTKPIYVAWLRPGSENYDVLALLSHELQKPN